MSGKVVDIASAEKRAWALGFIMSCMVLLVLAVFTMAVWYFCTAGIDALLQVK